MRMPRLRFTVRGMMVAVALISLAFVVAQEFRDGSPPRSVVRGIPARIGRLRPGMTWQQTSEILGLEKSWLRGGTSARFTESRGKSHHMLDFYEVRPSRIVYAPASVGGGPVQPTAFYRSTAVIKLEFVTGIHSKATDHRQDETTRLAGATFCSEGKVVAEMPRLPRPPSPPPDPIPTDAPPDKPRD